MKNLFCEFTNIFRKSINPNKKIFLFALRNELEILFVRPEGLEPSTFGTGIRRSIQLNYGRKIFLTKIKRINDLTNIIRNS